MYDLAPKSMDEAMRFAEMVSQSAFCPAAFSRKPGDVLCAIQFAAEVGLSPMQGLQNIAVINGKPSIYGDAALAVCRSHPAFVSIVERDASEAATKGGECTITVRNGDGTTTPVRRTFSPDDAKRAGLTTKSGPWSQYPGRMMQMRARAWAIRDALPEALKGIAIREEAEDYPAPRVVIPDTVAAPAPALPAPAPEAPADTFAERLAAVGSMDELAAVAKEIGAAGRSKDPGLKALYLDAKARLAEGAQ